MPDWLKEILPTLSAISIAMIGLAGSYLISKPKTDVERSKDNREVKDSWREETRDLWLRLDEQDKKITERNSSIEAQSVRIAELGRSISDRDVKIKELEQGIKELEYYKQRFTAVSLENDDLRRKVQENEELKRKVASLEKQVFELQRDTHKE